MNEDEYNDKNKSNFICKYAHSGCNYPESECVGFCLNKEKIVGAKESESMKKAKNLILNKGLTAYAAAKIVGLSAAAIYMAPWYKEWKKSNAKK